MKISILNPKGIVFEGSAQSVIAPSSDGLIGILPNHAPLLTKLGEGELKLKANGKEEAYPILGGVMEVVNNEITILSN